MPILNCVAQIFFAIKNIFVLIPEKIVGGTIEHLFNYSSQKVLLDEI